MRSGGPSAVPLRGEHCVQMLFDAAIQKSPT
jgi:hypothetical protein